MKLSLRMSGIFVMLVSFFVIGCMGGGAERVSAAGGQISQEQYFTLKNLEGESVSLQKELKSKKAVLINFWATWCPPCREEIPDLIKLQKERGGADFTILGVDVGEAAKQVSSFVESNGINYPVLLDADQSVAEKYNIVGIPTSILVNSEGKVLGTYHAVTPQMLRDVEKVLSV